jgi:hypothetical protein
MIVCGRHNRRRTPLLIIKVVPEHRPRIDHHRTAGAGLTAVSRSTSTCSDCHKIIFRVLDLLVTPLH